MISFTIEEALANLENPFKPKFLKKEVNVPQKVEREGQEGLDATNMANSFTKESWQEFCEKFNLHYFASQSDSITDVEYQLFVNYDNCVVIKFCSSKMYISTLCWTDFECTAHCDLLFMQDLSSFYANFYHATFPKSADTTILNLCMLSSEQRPVFFPCSSQVNENANWEEVRENILQLSTKENSMFVQRVCKLIDGELAKLSEMSKIVTVSVGDLVFRKNIVGDGSYGDKVLKIIDVFDTYVKYYTGIGERNQAMAAKYNEKCAFKGDFWDNFERLDVIISDLLSLILDIFGNVLNANIVESILIGKKWEGEVAFTRYESSSEFVKFKSNHFEISFFKGLRSPNEIRTSVGISKHIVEDCSEYREDSVYAEGFYTDALLVYALGYSEDCYKQFDFLKGLITQLQDGLRERELLSSAIEQVLADALSNVNKVIEYAITRDTEPPESRLLANVMEQEVVDNLSDSLDNSNIFDEENTSKGIMHGILSAFDEF